jgi:hypothetical protein
VLYASIAGPGRTPPGPLGFALVVVVGAASTTATALWWQHADHT